MKYSTTNSSDNLSTLFCDQVQQMTNFYDQWNDCERTVVISALFKRLPMANLKFLLHSIDHYLKNSLTTPQQLGLFEEAANAVSFLNKLVHKYNTLSNFKSSNDNIDSDQECIGNDNNVKSLENDLVSKYTNKEEIVQDLLTYLPLLRPNNDEAKKVYIQFLPVIAEDSMKQNLPMELVQQILSYLLIHPALKNEERKPLHLWSNKLQEHISLSISSTTNSIGSSGNNFINIIPDNVSSFMSNTSSMSSASSSSSASSTTWPTAVPQIQTSHNNDMFKSKREQEFWDLRNFQITHDLCDDLNQQMSKQTKYPMPIGNNNNNNNNSHNNINTNNSNNKNSSTNNASQNANDEHHISFSKNGTDVDFDNDLMMDSAQQKSTTSLTAINAMNATNDFLTVPGFYQDRIYEIFGYGSGGALSDGFSDDGSIIKTRRSNSLTTPSASGDFLMSSSAENLANLQKPRSFSLTMETSRNTLSGSDTRLDKLAQLRLDNSYSLQIGMGNIAVWLKSLRLHKYLWLFTNMSYEQMMEMTEEYLESLGVTKGARHKLVLCIQKLAERVMLLKQIEKELTDGTRTLKSGLDEITNIILSPMKPINSVPCDEDVATHVMRILDCAFKIIQGVKYFSSADEESVNIFLWVLDKTLHHDAFMQQVAHLKDYKFKLQRIKIMFGNKFSGGNSGNNNSNVNNNNSNVSNSNNNNLNKGNKARWNNKGKIPNQGTVDNQKHRKNSMPPYYMQQSYSQNQSVGNSKSLSFPNFGNVQTSNLSNFQRSASREKLNQFTLMQQQHQMQFNQQMNSQNNSAYQLHNSCNNLMPFGVHQMQQQNQLANRRNSSCGTDRVNSTLHAPLMMTNKSSSSEKLLNDSSMNTNFNALANSKSLTPTTSDINSRLESLCRQMTEQAIN